MFKGVPKIIGKMQQLHSRKLRDARNVGLTDPILLRLLLSCSICWAVAGKLLLDSLGMPDPGDTLGISVSSIGLRPGPSCPRPPSKNSY